MHDPSEKSVFLMNFGPSAAPGGLWLVNFSKNSDPHEKGLVLKICGPSAVPYGLASHIFQKNRTLPKMESSHSDPMGSHGVPWDGIAIAIAIAKAIAIAIAMVIAIAMSMAIAIAAWRRFPP